MLRVKNAKRRAELIAELVNLPIELSDIEAIPEKMKQEAGGDVEGWRARHRIAWAEKFRRHYESVEKKANEKVKRAAPKKKVK